MTSAATSLLSLVIIALGLLGIILSFLVPDRKKANISLGLAALIIFFGLYQFVAQSFGRYRLNQRMKDIQKEQQVNLDQLRERMKTPQGQSSSAPTQSGASATPSSKK